MEGYARVADSVLFDEDFLRKLEYLHIVSSKMFRGQLRAERRSKKMGSGLEFADHRDYAPGDDFRYLDWNLFGRLDRLLLRLFEEEEDLSVYFLLDVSASMFSGDPLKADYARRVVAALAYIALANLDRVMIVPFSDHLGDALAPKRGKGQIFTVIDFLKGLERGNETDLEAAAREFVHQTHHKGLAVVVSDLFDHRGFERGLNFIRYNRFDMYVLHVLDAGDFEPQIGGDVRLVDIETGQSREATISPPVIASYKEQLATFLGDVERYCRSKQAGYTRAVTNTPFDALVLSVLRRGGFLR